jgi:type I restriction enzyme R subunit
MRKLSERDICTKFITPALQKAGWDIDTQIREEVYLTKGRVILRGKLVSRGKRKFADYVLYRSPNIPIAVIEAKDNNHAVGDGMQQALNYSEMLQVPSVYSTNGDSFLEHDRSRGRVREREIKLGEFPSPEELWERYKRFKGISKDAEEIISQQFYTDASGRSPRYYQVAAVNSAVEAIAKGNKRALLVMATGTGKTYCAFQIIWRLWKAKVKKRILFLVDRNILADQTRNNDFKPFGAAMTKIAKRTIDKSYEIYLALYQAVTGIGDERNIFKQFSPDFFDLVVVDECHRGSASEDSSWHEILDYFSSAAHLGLTATPKETKDVSNKNYFGEPIFTYSLKQGIEDGFLAPYKVVRIDFDKDLEGWRPTRGETDKHGQVIEDRIYNQRDFDRNLVLEKRTALVAKKITDFLKGTNRYDKTIVFCEDIDHAERMRQDLVNQNADLVAENRKYVMRITGDEDEGKAELDNFINPQETYPVIVTTSKLLSTGVDAQTCKLIVLDQRIQSMTHFKQIIGRGTRINEDFNKYFFTIMDFKKATELFADPEFDGDPVQIYKPGPDDSPVPPVSDTEPKGNTEREETLEPRNSSDADGTDSFSDDDGQCRRKFYVDNVEVSVSAERVQYYGADGKLITQSLKDYTRKTIRKEYSTYTEFFRKWSETDRKQIILDELAERGVVFDGLSKEVGKDYSAFDLICHVAFDQPPLTRKERANQVRKKDYFSKFGERAREVLNSILDKYADSGIEDLDNLTLLRVPPIDSLGTPLEIVNLFGGKDEYIKVLNELENELYKTKAA